MKQAIVPLWVKVVSAVLIVGALVLAVYTSIRAQANAEELAEQTETVSQLESELATLKETPADDPVIVEKTLHSAKELGDKVAQLQTSYPEVMSDKEKSSALVKDLSSAFGDGNTKAFAAWLPSNRTGWTWEFGSSFEFSQDSMPCFWTCKDADGVLLAYAFADFDSTMGKFKNLSVETTKEGSKWLTASSSPAEVTQPSTSSSSSSSASVVTGPMDSDN